MADVIAGVRVDERPVLIRRVSIRLASGKELVGRLLESCGELSWVMGELDPPPGAAYARQTKKCGRAA